MFKSKTRNYTKSKINSFHFKHVANLIMVGYGCAIGWVSMALPLLQSNNSPLENGSLSVGEMSWIGSIVSIGALAGNLICGFAVTIIGARHTIFMIGFPQLVSEFQRAAPDKCFAIEAFHY